MASLWEEGRGTSELGGAYMEEKGKKKIEFEWSGLFFSSSKGEIEKRKG